MSRWTHVICVECWDARNPEHPAARPTKDGPLRTCCYCGAATRWGIFVHDDPDTLRCAGAHP